MFASPNHRLGARLLARIDFRHRAKGCRRDGPKSRSHNAEKNEPSSLSQPNPDQVGGIKGEPRSHGNSLFVDLGLLDDRLDEDLGHEKGLHSSRSTSANMVGTYDQGRDRQMNDAQARPPDPAFDIP